MTDIMRLTEYMKALVTEDICVAFSGGVDSSVILKAACDAAKEGGHKVYAVTFDTRLHPKADADVARKVAHEAGAIHHMLSVDELSIPIIMTNPVDRCYHCKKYLFTRLIHFAESKQVKIIIEGNNADDMKVYRPGTRAVKELGILSPLAQLGITKAQVREIAALMGLSVASRPSSPCLATRLPYNTKIDLELLSRIDAGERMMISRGFEVVRLRVHGDILRIEIPKVKFTDFLKVQEDIIKELKALGFCYITLDMEGFRSGSMDVHLKSE